MFNKIGHPTASIRDQIRRSRHGLGGSWKFLRAASEAQDVLMDGFMPKYHHFKHQTDGYFDENVFCKVLNMTVSEWR